MHKISCLGKITFTETAKVIKGKYQPIEKGTKMSFWMILTNLPIQNVNPV